ncbi:acyltransferase family protein [Aquiflexum gelatinilyticum]|uniref:acyltransferase family protein n=1 Tax=Aquiflexum gelatinilyticum TaxID=2961943 RepID=UPI00216914EE|nr:acyltransferase [Aquiflexum gelatinilyticum]MCS4434549.1 acyltransferase [Aquiflexum gelatinilyticum]
MNISTPTYFPALTGIRAIAVLMVYFHHFNPFAGSSGFAFRFFAEFHTGVTLFFVLSGFIITHKYFLNPSPSLSVYFWNRFTKIYPVFFILTMLTFLARAIYFSQFGEKEIPALILNLLLLKGYFQELLFSGIAQAWTLTVEETFYLSAPLLALAWKKWRLPLLLLPLTIISSGILIQNLFKDLFPFGFFGDLQFLFNFTFFGRCFEFLLGMGLAYHMQRRLPLKHLTLFGAAGILLSIVALAMIGNGEKTGDNFPLGILVNNFALPLFGILPLFWGLLHEETVLKKLLSSRLFRILGDSSYVFYLIHIGIFQLALASLGLSILTNLLLLYLFAILGYYFFEQPVKNYLRSRF